MKVLNASFPPSSIYQLERRATRGVAYLHLLELILIPLVHGDGTDERDMDTEACRSAFCEGVLEGGYAYLCVHQNTPDR